MQVSANDDNIRMYMCTQTKFISLERSLYLWLNVGEHIAMHICGACIQAMYTYVRTYVAI